MGMVTTTSPSFTPAAISAKRSASVPLLTPMEKRVSQNSAKSFSNPSTAGPPIKPAVRSAERKTLDELLFQLDVRSHQIKKRNF